MHLVPNLIMNDGRAIPQIGFGVWGLAGTR